MTEIAAHNKRFYDQGWNAAHRGEPADPGAFRDWQTGWSDYQTAKAVIPDDQLTTI